MCGFSGITQKNEAFIMHSQQLLSKRACDGSNTYISEKISLHHAHLQISDLDKNTLQPYETKGMILSFVGEIYNKQYLLGYCGIIDHDQDSYTENEIFALVFETYGIQGISQINGEFSLCIFDTYSGKTYLVRDRWGTKALYYRCHKNILSFSSEIKVLTFPEDEISHEAIYDTLIFGFTISPHTPLKDIFSLPAGNILIFDEKGIIIEPLEQYIFQESGDFLSVFESAVQRRIPKFQTKIFFPLSGGADSNLTLFFLKKHYFGEIITYTFLSDINQEDVKIAVYNAKVHGVKHTIIPIEDHLGENDISLHESLTFLLNIGKILKKSIAETSTIKVEFSGDGREELFLGNTHFDISSIQKRYDAIQKKYGTQKYNIESAFFNKAMFDFNLQLLEKVTLGNGIERRLPFTDYELLRFAGQGDLYTMVSRKHLFEHGFKIVPKIYGHNNAIHFSYPEKEDVLQDIKKLKEILTSASGKY